jgi:YD repeat-containing protein
MGYDALNRVTSESEPYGVSLTFGYDSADRMTLVQDSLGGTQTSVYDANGNLTSRQLSGNSMQARIDATYNADGSLTGLTRYSDVGGTALIVDWSNNNRWGAEYCSLVPCLPPARGQAP